MKPYSGHHEKGLKEKICNYRFSRSSRVVENLFGILASVFRIFRKPMLVEPNKAEIITLACLHLHNYLRKSSSSKQSYCQTGTVDFENIDTGEITPGTWRSDQVGLNRFIGLDRVGRKQTIEGHKIREEFKEYFNSNEGRVP